MGINYTAHNLQFSWDGKRDVFKNISFFSSPAIFSVLSGQMEQESNPDEMHD